jgi:hypothetical protein
MTSRASREGPFKYRRLVFGLLHGLLTSLGLDSLIIDCYLMYAFSAVKTHFPSHFVHRGLALSGLQRNEVANTRAMSS